MGIKVEHQGNATSRVVAANLGGQAQSSQQQATAAAQRAASENMAANRQLDGARATGATPGHATATTASAPVGGGKGGASAPAYRDKRFDYKVVGTDLQHKPREDAVWDSDKQAWTIPWSKEKEMAQFGSDLKLREDAGLLQNRMATIPKIQNLIGSSRGADVYRMMQALNPSSAGVQGESAVAQNGDNGALKWQVQTALNTAMQAINERVHGVRPSVPGGQQTAPQTPAANAPYDYVDSYNRGVNIFGNDGVMPTSGYEPQGFYDGDVNMAYGANRMFA